MMGTQPAEELAAWSRDVAEVIAGLGQPALPALLDSALRRLVPFDISILLAYPDGRGPLLLHDGLRDTGEPGALDAYLGGTYLLDPFYLACSERIAPGLYRMSDLAPDRFFESDYVRSPHVHPCISLNSGTLAEEIGFVIGLPSGYHAAYSLMRSNGGALFSGPEIARLRAVQPVVMQVVTSHWRHLPRAPGRHGPPAERQLEEAFATLAPGTLTRQQQRIVQLLLRGHSTASVAALLGISQATAKTHRKAIYERLGISSQSELFALFLRHVRGEA
jgi:DNA-binding CsgD family transcriptional regulator